MVREAKERRLSASARWYRLWRPVYRRLPIAVIPVRAFLPSRDERVVITQRLSEALTLLATHSPVRYACFRRDVRQILVGGTPHHGVWIGSDRLVLLNDEYVTAAATTPAEIALTLIHEGMHARLDRFGFTYTESERARIERLCVEAELLVARRMPDADALAKAAESRLDFGPGFWTDRAIKARLEGTLKELGWLGRIGHWLGRLVAVLHRPPAG